MRVGLFGGSFDPVHNGHLIVARDAARQLDLDLVLLVPARAQPFKAGRHRASAGDRLAMLDLAVGSDPLFRTDDRELRRPGPSYTVDTLRALRAAYPGDELFLLVGADAARDLPGWREADAIPALATVVAVTRPGVAETAHPLIARTIRVPAVDISASAVRARLARGAPVDDVVPAAVAGYIAERRLYLEGE